MAVGQCEARECVGSDPQVLTASFCSKHYQRKRKYGDPDHPVRRPRPEFCRVDGCGAPAKARDLCSAHRKRERETGDVQADKPVRRNPTRRHVIKTSGYARIKIDYPHPRAYSSGWILEHIVVMEQKLNRRLLPGENVHHLNGVRDDNRPENLELWVIMQPTGQRPEQLVEWAREVLRRYG